jgi:hypothetical protein
LIQAFALGYERLVERLLQSPRYGERSARHWLDTIHFAEAHGCGHDLPRDHAWRSRDYVIEPLNRDTPRPRFVREQLAADRFYAAGVPPVRSKSFGLSHKPRRQVEGHAAGGARFAEWPVGSSPARFHGDPGAASRPRHEGMINGTGRARSSR